jgi:hypothetical protein
VVEQWLSASVSRTPAEAGDLTLWTGRLAYADPRWALSSGPAHEPRPPQDLAPHERDVPLAVAAVPMRATP